MEIGVLGREIDGLFKFRLCPWELLQASVGFPQQFVCPRLPRSHPNRLEKIRNGFLIAILVQEKIPEIDKRSGISAGFVLLANICLRGG